jgi:hypothetical protein
MFQILAVFSRFFPPFLVPIPVFAADLHVRE